MRQHVLRGELSDTTACAWFLPDQAHLTVGQLFVTQDDLSLRCAVQATPPPSQEAAPSWVGASLPATTPFINRPAEETGLLLLFQRRLFTWRFSVLKRNPRLWQTSLRRIPLTNSATNC